MEIKRVIEGEKMAVIICRKGDGPKLVGKDGVMIKRLSKLFGKPLRVVEESETVKEFIQNLIHPVPMIGLNVIYKPDKEILKVIIPRGEKIPASSRAFADVVKKVFGKDLIFSRE